jgi:leishmanolysin
MKSWIVPLGRRSRRLPARARVLSLVVALFGAAGCTASDSTAPSTPVSLTRAQGSTLSGTVGAVLTSSPTFEVKDDRGNDIANVAVTVTVTAGAGSITGAPTRTGSGPTPVGTWTLGTTAGTNVLTITVSGLAPLTIAAAGTPDVPSQVVIVSGGGQAGAANAPLPLPIIVRVADRFGNGVPGVLAAFSVTQGGGSLSGTTIRTSDLTGAVTAPTWTLGKAAAPQRLTVTSATATALLDASVATNFSVDLRFFGPVVDVSIQQAFTRATQRVGGMVTGDIPDVSLAAFDVASQCGVTGVAPMTETVDDVVIFATVIPIDGPGKVLGSSGPCIIRTAAQGRLTIIGVMQFDVADLQNLSLDGRLDDVILHEMLHVLGFGTLWQFKGLIINAGLPTTAFTGVQAIQGCIAVGGVSTCAVTVPLESTGGPGTADGHWRESVFRTELMTGFVSPAGVPNPLSLMTIGSMADLGYVVNMTVNDAYSIASAAASSLETIRGAQGLGAETFTELLLLPRLEAGPGGRVSKLPEMR